jgi:hypothetical protein
MEFRELLRNPKVFWALWGLVAASWQINSLKTHNGATGSETTRAWWRVHTKPGKYAFLAAFYGGSLFFVSWFPDHIIRPAAESISSTSGVISDGDQ